MHTMISACESLYGPDAWNVFEHKLYTLRRPINATAAADKAARIRTNAYVNMFVVAHHNQLVRETGGFVES